MSNASVALIASALMIEQVTYWLDYDADELVTESTQQSTIKILKAGELFQLAKD